MSNKEILLAVLTACGLRGMEETMEEIASDLTAAGVTVQKWIPVAERLPEVKEIKIEDEVQPSGFFIVKSSEFVLATTAEGSVHIAQYSESAKAWNDEPGNVMRITHWMPLPELPKNPHKLKPCAFCGGKAHIREHACIKGPTYFTIHCEGCGICDLSHHKSEAAAADTWNRRATDVQ